MCGPSFVPLMVIVKVLRRLVSVGILHRVGKGLLQALALIQGLNRCVGVVQGIAVGAVARVGEGAVSSRRACPAVEALRGVGAGLVVIQNVARDRCGDVFRNAVGVSHRVSVRRQLYRW